MTEIIPNPNFTFHLKQMLGNQYSIAQINNSTWRIDMPFLDYINDNLVIYVIKKGKEYLLTDDGWYFDEQELMQITPHGYKALLDRYKVQVVDGELSTSCSYDGLMTNILMMIQALIAFDATMIQAE